ncbi:TIGR04086 family membrane protein [Pseudomaricurvus alcaniphilus]|uniref:TIGR04086 family membrane protein n=1 Tax=Pseudomaricurvus alcaniphilus TaxID=1166482 RepID=UPI00140ADC60|nr:TIGR04086 family membrane protein [Pseudomaricurvus alcaniphilus]NHN36234.1 TIGR04086 family membrane protein [Pseudomaricurvus alcaniphilus]
MAGEHRSHRRRIPLAAIALLSFCLAEGTAAATSRLEAAPIKRLELSTERTTQLATETATAISAERAPEPSPALTAESIKSRELHVLTKPGTTASASSSLQRVTADNFNSLVTSKAVLVERVDAKPSVVEQAGATVWQSQYRVLMPKSEREPDQLWTLRPIVRVLNALQYDEGKRQFSARLSIGVVDESEPRLRRPLAAPFMIDVASDSLRSISPQSMQFDRSALFKTVDVFDNAPTEPASVRILLAGDDATGSEVELPVRRPSLQLSLNPTRILGMGLETTQLTVNAVGLREPEGMTISLGTDHGRFQQPILVLNAQGFATTTLRSAGLGQASIEAGGSPFTTTSANVTFALPWTFLLAVILGGFIGALATRGGRAHWLNSTVTGVATGMIAAVLYAVGVNVVGFEPVAQVGEAVTFAIAALGAVLGPGIFGKSARSRRDGDMDAAS